MEYTNYQIDTEQLPELNKLDLIPLDIRYRKIMFINVVPSLIFPVGWIAATFIFGFWDTPLFALSILFVALCIPVLNLILVQPSFRIKKFAVRKRDIIYQTGLIFRSLVVIPFKRVQHCEITRGPLSRVFGLSELNIYTAGGSSSDLSIPGLDEKTAEQLCRFVLTKIKESDEEE